MATQEGTIQERVIEYPIGDAIYQGLLAWDEGISGPRPGVLVAHAWGGRSPFEDDKARWLASLGYAGFALDMYGKGIRGATVEENTALMTPLVDNRDELQARIGAALSTLREQDEVDARRCAAMGFCFGGLCVLDLARIGTPLAGVVSVHGLFNPPGNTRDTAIQARVLCLHGYDDPMVEPAAVLELAAELSAAGADWQVHAYGGTRHAFTNPQANDAQMGTIYSATADRRAHVAMRNFFAELFDG